MKKHGCLWWAVIGWWWAPITLPFRILSALLKRKPQQANAPAPARGSNEETHKVAGVSFQQDTILKLAQPNEDYAKTKKELLAEGLTDQRIYEYEFYPSKVELVPEPDNPHDPKAVKVVVDGLHIGYIKAGSCAHIHKLLRESRIDRITCQLGGGKSKMLTQDEDDGRYVLETDKGEFWARLTITTKPT